MSIRIAPRTINGRRVADNRLRTAIIVPAITKTLGCSGAITSFLCASGY